MLSCGRYAVVRNANGKNKRNALLTAVGLPVRRAMEYGKPVKARPHNPAISTNTMMPSRPVAEWIPTASPRRATGVASAMISTTSAVINPSSNVPRLTGVSSSRSK